MQWPLQSECDQFYGNPRLHRDIWENVNLVHIIPPWQMIDEDTKEHISSFRMHRKVKDSLDDILYKIWELYGRDQKKIEENHLHLFSGSYVFRNIRGGSHLSMHAYGCALDLAANLNPLGEHSDNMPKPVVKIFEDHGWVWGGHWNRPDEMHFQGARVG